MRPSRFPEEKPCRHDLGVIEDHHLVPFKIIGEIMENIFLYLAVIPVYEELRSVPPFQWKFGNPLIGQPVIIIAYSYFRYHSVFSVYFDFRCKIIQ